MPAATPHFISLFQNEVFIIISTLNAGSLCSRVVNNGNTTVNKTHGLETRRNTKLLIIYVGVGLCKNMGAIWSRVYRIYFESTNCYV